MIQSTLYILQEIFMSFAAVGALPEPDPHLHGVTTRNTENSPTTIAVTFELIIPRYLGDFNSRGRSFRLSWTLN